MEQFWNIAIAAVGLGALATFVLWSLYKQWLKLPIFQQLTKDHQFSLFKLFLLLTFLFALAALAAYVYLNINKPTPASSADTQKLYEHTPQIAEPYHIEDIPKIRSRYFDIRGHGISLLLEGRLDNNLKNILGGDFWVWKNQVYDYIYDLRINHTISYDSLWHFGYMSIEYDSLHLESSYAPPSHIIPGVFFYTEPYFDLDLDNEYDFGLTVISDTSIYVSDKWSASIVNSPYYLENTLAEDLLDGRIYLEHLSLRQFISRNEALNFLKKYSTPESISLYKFYDYISKGGVSDSFFTFNSYLNACGGDPILSARFRAPLLSLRVIVIENISDNPITINQVLGQLKYSEGIEDSINDLQHTTLVSEELRESILIPGDLIIIPTDVFFSNTDSRYSDWDDKPHINISSIFDTDSLYRRFFDNIDTLITYADYNTHTLIMNSDIFADEYINLTYDDREFYKMSLQIDSIYINNLSYSITPYDKESIFVSHGIDSGSCPFLYSSDRKILGKVLTGRDSKQKEGIYVKRLDAIYSSFIVYEREYEISYIKWARMLCKNDNNSLVYIEPIENTLRYDNDEYLVLRKYDQSSISFELPDNLVECSLIISGYYTPQA